MASSVPKTARLGRRRLQAERRAGKKTGQKGKKMCLHRNDELCATEGHLQRRSLGINYKNK